MSSSRETYQASGHSSGSACVAQEGPHLPSHLSPYYESAEVEEDHSDSSPLDPWAYSVWVAERQFSETETVSPTNILYAHACGTTTTYVTTVQRHAVKAFIVSSEAFNYSYGLTSNFSKLIPQFFFC